MMDQAIGIGMVRSSANGLRRDEFGAGVTVHGPADDPNVTQVTDRCDLQCIFA